MYTLQVGDKVKLEIRKQGINGEGIGYFNQIAIFVPGAITKEVILGEITEVKEGYAIAQMSGIERPSTKRIEPQCKFYDKCGGCQTQHIEYVEQLKMKQSILRQALRRYTPELDEDKLVRKTLGAKDIFGYRNKSQMPIRNLNFGLSLGLFEPNSNKFVYVDNCLVQHPKINEINAKVLKILRRHNMTANDSLNKEGILIYLATRYLANSNQSSVTFIVSDYSPILATIAEEVRKEIPVVVSVSYSLSRRNSVNVFTDKVVVLSGSATISDTIKDLKFNVSPDAFHQLNTKQMEVLYDFIINTLTLSKDDIVFDCFSGIGITTLLLSKHVKKCYGIDYSEASIKDAKENAKINGITNVEMIEDHVEGALPKLLSKGIVPDIVLFDPPRTGLDNSVIDALIKTRVKRIVYVSCNPSTLAKNIKSLSNTYKVEFIQPLDMFPQTAQVESITLLTRKTL